jgi:hypothetical protein
MSVMTAVVVLSMKISKPLAEIRSAKRVTTLSEEDSLLEAFGSCLHSVFIVYLLIVNFILEEKELKKQQRLQNKNLKFLSKKLQTYPQN